MDIKKTNRGAGLRKKNCPLTVGEILHNYLENSNEPLAVAYREHSLETDEPERHRNTELGVNLKTFLRSDKRMLVNKEYPGILRLDSQADIDEFRCCDPHMTFYEAASKSYVCHRNVHLYEGRHITCTKRLNGSLRLNFKNLKLDAAFSVDGYALEVANEIRNALKGLVEEK